MELISGQSAVRMPVQAMYHKVAVTRNIFPTFIPTFFLGGKIFSLLTKDCAVTSKFPLMFL